MADDDKAPGSVESTAAAIAGPAFAGSLLFLRHATPVPAGVFDGVATLLVGFGLAPLAHRRFGPVAATLLRGASLAASSILVLLSFVEPWSRAAGPVAVLVAGGALLQASTRAKEGRALAASGLVVLSVGFAYAWLLSGGFPEPNRLRGALVFSAGTTALLLLARMFAQGKLHDALIPGPAGILGASAVGATYLSYRSLVAQHVGNLPLYEWSLGVSLSLLLLAKLRRGARDGESAEAWASDARRHAQDSTPLYDARMGPLAASIARYLETGAGFEDYRAALEKAAPDAAPSLRRILPAPIAPLGKSRAARRDAAAQRAAAHGAAMEALQPRIVTRSR